MALRAVLHGAGDLITNNSYLSDPLKTSTFAGQIRKKGNFAKQNFPDIFNGTHASRLARALSKTVRI